MNQIKNRKDDELCLFKTQPSINIKNKYKMKNGYYEVGDTIMLSNLGVAIFISQNYADDNVGDKRWFMKFEEDVESVVPQEDARDLLRPIDQILFDEHFKNEKK